MTSGTVSSVLVELSQRAQVLLGIFNFLIDPCQSDQTVPFNSLGKLSDFILFFKEN